MARIFSVARAAIRRAYDNEEIAVVPPILRFARSESRDCILTIEESAALFAQLWPTHLCAEKSRDPVYQ
jgi:hypothetical protein